MSIAASPPIKLALTLGDPAGIGGEITLKALARIALGRKQLARQLSTRIRSQKLTLGIMGSRAFLKQQLKFFSIKEQGRSIPLKKLFKFLGPDRLSVSAPVDRNDKIAARTDRAFTVQLYSEESKSLSQSERGWDALKPGIPSRLSGAIALSWLKGGCELIEKKLVDALVTAPLSKAAIARSVPDFVGHTEYLESYFKSVCKKEFQYENLKLLNPPLIPVQQGKTPNLKNFALKSSALKSSPLKVSMGFVSPDFNLTLMTRHLALKDVSKHLTLETIVRTLHHADLLAILTQKTKSPKKIPLAILSLNPHGGEQGLFGTEEQRIEKAIKLYEKYTRKASKFSPLKQLSLEGPLSADTAFLKVGRKKRYQQVVACYHDQGLIPLKTQANLMAVNVTLGLPFIRTSVDHGTAFDIAGKDLADETSLLYALDQAWRLQANYQTLFRSPSPYTAPNKPLTALNGIKVKI